MVPTRPGATRNLDRNVIRRDGDAVVVDLHRWVQYERIRPAGRRELAVS